MRNTTGSIPPVYKAGARGLVIAGLSIGMLLSRSLCVSRRYPQHVQESVSQLFLLLLLMASEFVF